MESDDGHSLKLTWTDHAKNVSIAFIDLLEQKEFIDVTLSADGHMFSAHRLILSAVSPHFRQMLNKVPANQQAFVILNGISVPMVKYLLAYIYRGEVNIKQTDLEDFLQIAKNLRIKGLNEDEDEKPPKTLYSRPHIPTNLSAEPASNVPLYQSTQSNDHQKTANKNDSKRSFVHVPNLQETGVDKNTSQSDTNVELNLQKKRKILIERLRKRLGRPIYSESSTDEEQEDEPPEQRSLRCKH